MRLNQLQNSPQRQFKFSLVYLHDEDGVYVVAIAPTRRKPGYWRARVSDAQHVSRPDRLRRPVTFTSNRSTKAPPLSVFDGKLRVHYGQAYVLAPECDMLLPEDAFFGPTLKDAKKLASAGLKENAQELLEILERNPLFRKERTVRVLRMWTHYE